MSIAFQCPHCGKAYKVKDELAGKRAACQQCKKMMVVPTGAAVKPAVDHGLLETMAIEALTDVPVAAPVETVTEIRTECPFCFESIAFPASMAGKRAPCPNCRRIQPVPALPDPKKKEGWREKGAERRFGERLDQEQAPEGAWGNVETGYVSGESLQEAGAVPDKRRRPLTRQQIINRSMAVVGIVLLATAGYLVLGQRRVQANLAGLIESAEKAADPKADPKLSPLQIAALHRTIGEYHLRRKQPDYPAATRSLRLARAALSGSEGGLDRLMLVGEIALLQAELGGDAEAVKNDSRLTWSDCQKEVRQTLDLIARVESRENRDFTLWILERLARQLGTTGTKEPMVLALVANALPAEERADGRGVAGLALLAHGDAGRKVAETIATEDRETPPTPGSETGSDQTALLVALGQLPAARKLLPEPGMAEPKPVERFAYITGFAHTADGRERARQIAALPGAFEAKLDGLALLADATGEAADCQAAVDLAVEQLKRFTVNPIYLARLADACRRANRPDLIDKLAAEITNAPARGWVQLAAVRARGTGAADVGEPASVPQSLAVAAQARLTGAGKDPRAEAGKLAHATQQPFALAGAAAGLDRK